MLTFWQQMTDSSKQSFCVHVLSTNNRPKSSPFPLLKLQNNVIGSEKLPIHFEVLPVNERLIENSCQCSRFCFPNISNNNEPLPRYNLKYSRHFPKDPDISRAYIPSRVPINSGALLNMLPVVWRCQDMPRTVGG